jgi:hypothetical protein
VGHSLTRMSLEVVILVLSGLVAINVVLVSALITTIRQDRARAAPRPTHGSAAGPPGGSV